MAHSRTWIQLHYGRAGKNIIKSDMPILGKVWVHRKAEYQLRSALQELEDKRLSKLISIAQWKAGGGCYVYRKMRGSNNLSHHSWGIAIDLNHQSCPFKSLRKQDQRLVAIFEKWGFECGQNWRTVKDPMHFEIVKIIKEAEVKKPHWGDKDLEELKTNGYITSSKDPESSVIWAAFAKVFNLGRKNLKKLIFTVAIEILVAVKHNEIDKRIKDYQERLKRCQK